MQQTHGCRHFSVSLLEIFLTLESFHSPQISPARKISLAKFLLFHQHVKAENNLCFVSVCVSSPVLPRYFSIPSLPK